MGWGRVGSQCSEASPSWRNSLLFDGVVDLLASFPAGCLLEGAAHGCDFLFLPAKDGWLPCHMGHPRLAITVQGRVGFDVRFHAVK